MIEEDWMRKILTLIVAVTTLFIFQTKAEAVMNFSLDANPGLAGNSMGDIVYDGNNIWVGTGDGLSYSPDSGKTWFTYDNTNGLNANDISALAVYDSTLWVACAYSKMIEGEPIPYGKGFNKTTNRGEDWESHIPKQVDFAGEIAYDIAFDDSSVWAACWYGGLIHSFVDYDTLKWENIFVSDAAKEDYEEGYYEHLDNRFFSVAVDTFCPHDKKLKNSINDIIFDDRFLWVGTQNGLRVTGDDGETWLTYDTSNGLNANGVHSLTGYTSFSDNDTTSFLYAGLYSGEKEYEIPLLPSLTGEGFNFTSDYGYTWDTSLTEQATDLEKFAYDIAIADTVVWAACGKGGLIRSFDWGKTWENVFVDTSAKRRYEQDSLELKDVFISVAVDTFALDTTAIWAGTENGVYKFIYTTSDSADTVLHFLEGNELFSHSVLSLGIQKYGQSKIIWASACTEGLGVSSCSTYKSTDGGETWESYLGGVWVRDFAFQNSMVWAATDQGLKRTPDGGIYWETFEILDTLGQAIIPSNFTSVCVVETTIWVDTVIVVDTAVWAGTVDGLVKSTDDGKNWQVIKFAQSFEKAIWAGTAAGIFKFIYNYRDVFDTVLNYNSYSGDITGDFVVSTAIQEYNDKKIIWAGTQPTYSGAYGASKSTDDGDSWSVTLGGDRVWNFAFDGSVVWAATSSGLKRSSNGGESWDVFNYMKDKDEITEDGIFSTEFTSVAIIEDEVWAGNADGLVKARKDVEVGEDTVWNVFRTFVPIGTKGSETAYAYPSPFSPMLSTGGVVRIHYKPRKDGPVTIKLYDFAMSLVTTLVDNQDRVGGEEYDEPWNGKNDEGDVVANGIYFFKVEASGGQTEWGKLVVLK
jgi:hypothetical protein